jgi:hypothetical protein
MNVLRCGCDACKALRKRYGKDVALLQASAKKLLDRAWPGIMDDTEKAYRKAHRNNP